MEKVEQGRKVTIEYAMKSHYPDGTVKEHPTERLTFIYGVDRQPPSLEKALEGSRVGQRLKVIIPPSEIYGDHDSSLIKEIPRKGLIKQRLKEGQFYRQMKMGSLVSFRVLEIRENTVLADFNRAMAGIGVSLDLEVLKIDGASRTEINDAIRAQAQRSIGCG
ncbi:MAG: FKBP-type peptidyl-prolyl cis-trans isomerase [Deltaproteobacteria bacterium]|nr:FKBP-type peptidyl-prolyl cis-trans isomerase [Deltaproteobacteria bacterium]MBW2137780.1 FKBP-type peptidyl-prolyl cis-trans isomerase [Deltaproteobacteria bacterium]